VDRSGGRAFTAEGADQLNSIDKTLGSRLGIKKQPKKITASLAVGRPILLFGAGAPRSDGPGACPDRRTQPPSPGCPRHP
jgi:hypothetical protein